jgi:hypothetical protein
VSFEERPSTRVGVKRSRLKPCSSRAASRCPAGNAFSCRISKDPSALHCKSTAVVLTLDIPTDLQKQTCTNAVGVSDTQEQQEIPADV